MTLKGEYFVFETCVSWIKINQYLLEHQPHVESSNQGTINEASKSVLVQLPVCDTQENNSIGGITCKLCLVLQLNAKTVVYLHFSLQVTAGRLTVPEQST